MQWISSNICGHLDLLMEERRTKCKNVFSKTKEKDHLGYLDIGGRIILKWLLESGL
jgi:hypothetical protein